MAPPTTKGSFALPTDVCRLASINEESVEKLLSDRSKVGKMYTYCGDELLCMFSPSQMEGHFSQDSAKFFSQPSESNKYPHVFRTSGDIYQSMLENKENQTMVFTGMSGSGKSTNYAKALDQLLSVSRRQPNVLEDKIMAAHTIMDAFGNAHTPNSINSTRYCKHFEIVFDSQGALAGAVVNEYLLEKTRIFARNNMANSNFHVFYYVLQGLKEENVITPKNLTSDDAFNYLYSSVVMNDNELLKKYHELIKAMDIVGFTTEEQQSIFAILSGVLYIGNLEFETDRKGDVCVSTRDVLTEISNVLEIDTSLIELVLTTKITGVEESGEPILTSYSLKNAYYVRDAWASSIYGRTFGYICHRLNEFLQEGGNLSSIGNKSIALVDSFGFERMPENSFEQLVVNTVNEALQFLVNQSTFVTHKEDFQQEQVDGELKLEYLDNTYCMNTLKADNRFAGPGVLDIIDFKANSLANNLPNNIFVDGVINDSDADLLNALHCAWNGEGAYKKPKAASKGFGINHNFGCVNYSIDNFMTKNRQAVPDDVHAAMRSSKMLILSDIFKADLSKAGMLYYKKNNQNLSKPEGLQTLASACENAVSDFIKLVAMSEMNVIKCLKPNSTNSQGSEIDSTFVVEQIKGMNIVFAAKLYKEGFIRALTFQDFNATFRCLVKSGNSNISQRDLCQKILNHEHISEYIFGIHKVYLNPKSFAVLAEACTKAKNSNATSAEQIMKGQLVREKMERKNNSNGLGSKTGESMLVGSRKTFGSSEDLLRSQSIVIGSLTKEYLDFTQTQNERGVFPATVESNKSGHKNCYFGELSKRDMEKVLDCKPNGCFIVRDSHGEFHETIKVICVSWEGSIKQYKIVPTSTGAFQCGGKEFPMVDDILAHFIKEPLTQEGVILRCPVPCPAEHLNQAIGPKNPKIVKLEEERAKLTKKIEQIKHSIVNDNVDLKEKQKRKEHIAKEEKAIEKINKQLQKALGKVEEHHPVAHSNQTSDKISEHSNLPPSLQRNGSIFMNEKISSLQNEISNEIASRDNCEKHLRLQTPGSEPAVKAAKELKHHEDLISKLTGQLNTERSKEIQKQQKLRRASESRKKKESFSGNSGDGQAYTGGAKKRSSWQSIAHVITFKNAFSTPPPVKASNSSGSTSGQIMKPVEQQSKVVTKDEAQASLESALEGKSKAAPVANENSNPAKTSDIEISV
eukprot:Nk52_evm23s2657 gene=Nk52_evmTU23s2657